MNINLTYYMYFSLYIFNLFAFIILLLARNMLICSIKMLSHSTNTLSFLQVKLAMPSTHSNYKKKALIHEYKKKNIYMIYFLVFRHCFMLFSSWFKTSFISQSYSNSLVSFKCFSINYLSRFHCWLWEGIFNFPSAFVLFCFVCLFQQIKYLYRFHGLQWEHVLEWSRNLHTFLICWRQ